MIRTRLKLAATLTLVVFALTGFQTSRGHGHGSHGSHGGYGGSSDHGKSDDSGGGCSTPKKRNHYDSDDDDDYGSGSGSGDTTSASPSPAVSEEPDVDVVVVDCVKPAGKKGTGAGTGMGKGKPGGRADTTATVRVTAKPGVTGTYRIALTFEERANVPVDGGEILVKIDGPGEKRYDVPMKNPKSVDRVKLCTVGNVWEDDSSPTEPLATPRR
ncbi:hypothetical protein ABZ990_15870 [Streptomyces sp. NPDC046203]|uniref:hypothetical protein n=1 Tax=Streptomyces sp. NPDC046203 TaxID=3154602 RepID=UPI0033ECFA30